MDCKLTNLIKRELTQRQAHIFFQKKKKKKKKKKKTATGLELTPF